MSERVIEVVDSEDKGKGVIESDSEEETQFGLVWGSPGIPETELQDSDVEEDNIPFSELMEKRKTDKQQTIVLITETEDQVSEPVVIDEVPSVTVKKTTVTEATMTETVIQLVKVAKHFEAGLFIGEITAVSLNRGRNLYTVLYENGDGEDMNDREIVQKG